MQQIHLSLHFLSLLIIPHIYIQLSLICTLNYLLILLKTIIHFFLPSNYPSFACASCHLVIIKLYLSRLSIYLYLQFSFTSTLNDPLLLPLITRHFYPQLPFTSTLDSPSLLPSITLHFYLDYPSLLPSMTLHFSSQLPFTSPLNYPSLLPSIILHCYPQ